MKTEHLLLLAGALLVAMALRMPVEEIPNTKTPILRETPSANAQADAHSVPEVTWGLGLGDSLELGNWSLELQPMSSNDLATLYALAPELDPAWAQLPRERKFWDVGQNDDEAKP